MTEGNRLLGLVIDMARAAEIAEPPYNNLESYKKYKGFDR